MLESAIKDGTGTIQFMTPISGSDTGILQSKRFDQLPVTESLAHWTLDPSYEWTSDSMYELPEVSMHLSINSAGHLVPVFDMENAKARFICQHTPARTSGTPLEFDAARKPLARSGLAFHPNV